MADWPFPEAPKFGGTVVLILSLQHLKTGKEDGHEHGEKHQTQAGHRPSDKRRACFRGSLSADQSKYAVGQNGNRQHQEEWTQAQAEPRERRWSLRPVR